MRVMAFAALLLSFAAAGETQTPDDLRIVVSEQQLIIDGGEKTVTSLEAGLGKTSVGTFSSKACAQFSLHAASDLFDQADFPAGAFTAWQVQVTPGRVANGAVSFRLRWRRGVDKGKPSTAEHGDIELTLKPGEGRTLDRVPVPADGRTGNGGPCRVSEAALRVSVDYYPMADFDRRLIAADLWLVERLPNGSERSQPLSVRGVPNRTIPFYFDSIVQGTVSLEIFGEVIARVESGALDVTLRPRSRWGATAFDWRDAFSARTKRMEDNVFRVRPDETVELSLPPFTLATPAGDASSFTERAYSIRIRARQVR
jgi:hypothetical protein